MKTHTTNRSWRILGVVLVALCMAGTVVQAQSGNGNPNGNGNGGNGNHNGWGGGAPTAPEPDVLPMVAGGIVMVGCYAFYRLRRRDATRGSAES